MDTSTKKEGRKKMSYTGSMEQFITMDLNEMRPEGFLQNILQRQKNNINTVNINNGWKKRECCPVCKSSEKQFKFTKFGFDLYQCIECSTGFFSQVPVNTNDIYSASYTLGDAKQAYLNNKDYRKIRFALERVQLIENHLSGTIQGRNILDVGCGTGWFLEVAKENGANCYGVELGKDLANYTSENLGIKVWNCDLGQVKTNTGFDVITMFDLIEHVENPYLLIEGAKRLLNEDGFIVIFTPQFDSLGIQMMKENSNLIMPAEHLSYFTEKSVEKLAELSEMKVIYYATKGIDLGDLKSFYEFKKDSKMADSCASLYNIVQPFIDSSKSGNHLRAILKKL